MSSPDVAEDGSWSAAARGTLLVLLVGTCTSLVWLVHPWFDAISDAALYVLTAKSLAAGEGYRYLGEPFIIRPPGFSALLAPLIAWRGTDFLALNLFVSAWGVAAVGLLFAWALPRLGSLLAAAVALCVWLNPCWRELCNQTMSDVPGAALLLLCLLLERRARRVPSRGRDAWLGLVLGLSATVRIGLVLLVPAVLVQRVLARWRQGRTGDAATARSAGPWRAFVRERLLLVLALPLLVLAPLKVREARAPTTPSDQTSLHSYATAMWHADGGDPSSRRLTASEILARVPKRAHQILAALGTRLRSSETGAEATDAETLLGLLALALALALMLRENRVEGWFLLATLAVLLVYFDFATRLVLPVHLLVLPALVELLQRGLRRVVAARWSRILVAVLLALLCTFDLDGHPRWRAIERSDRAYRALCAELAPHLEPETRLAAVSGWYYAIYLDRPVASLLFGWARGKAPGLEAVLDRYRIDQVVLSPGGAGNPRLQQYLVERYGIKERVGEQTLVRVR